ncbi:unnamed protein product [Sphagnum tenellum]
MDCVVEGIIEAKNSCLGSACDWVNSIPWCIVFAISLKWHGGFLEDVDQLFGSLGKESLSELLLGSGCQFGSNYQSLGMGFSCCFDSMLDLSAAGDSALL